MKREHTLLKSEPLPPFGENLVFWAPLVDGDLTDHISGVVGRIPVNNTNCTITWDSDIDMYRINNRVRGYTGLWWHGLDMFPDAIDGQTLMRDVHKTIYYEVRVKTNPNGNGYASSVGVGAGNDGYNYNVSAIEAQRPVAEYQAPIKPPFNCSVGTTYNIILVREGLSYKAYRNKVLVQSSDTDSWTLHYHNHYGTRMSMVWCPSNAGNIADMYIKDVRIYNRALTSSEVVQL